MAEFTLVKTCGGCPESYDVYRGAELVGWMRLRHGQFAAYVDDDEPVYVPEEDPAGDGIFDCDEREKFLTAACLAIKASLDKRSGPLWEFGLTPA